VPGCNAEVCQLVSAAWVLANMFTFFYVLKLLGYFRVNAADEAAGLDASHHGGSAYPLDLDDDASHKGSSYNGNQSGYNKVCARVCVLCIAFVASTVFVSSCLEAPCVAWCQKHFV